MRIHEITFRSRNDFHFIAECDCGKQSKWGDGYADAFYCQQVFPNRCCPHCGLSEYGETYEAQQARWAAEEASRKAVTA